MDPDSPRRIEHLTARERLVAGLAAIVLLLLAVGASMFPPGRSVALESCVRASAGCVVEIDADLSTLAVALSASAVLIGLVGLLGLRFSTLKAGGFELQSYEEAVRGLGRADPRMTSTGGIVAEIVDDELLGIEESATIEVSVERGLGQRLGTVPVAVTRSTATLESTPRAELQDYQSARRESQRSYFLTHRLGPARSPRQKYSVAIYLTPHTEDAPPVVAAQFYLGRSWGNQVFDAPEGADGRFGIDTEAYGPFLVLCEVEFDDGDRIVLDHYCDFEMGSLVG